jgi:hypothetical protein
MLILLLQSIPNLGVEDLLSHVLAAGGDQESWLLRVVKEVPFRSDWGVELEEISYAGMIAAMNCLGGHEVAAQRFSGVHALDTDFWGGEPEVEQVESMGRRFG